LWFKLFSLPIFVCQSCLEKARNPQLGLTLS
jgi:hypothetical protein